ncbi:unnamed protein product [Lactuca virosa]|uniref:DUF538 domain-containing protein n=1 Tax=Lactuca virosa TaxID=75947 RepID=A0AAU9PSZ9_9ASTR|nr:unnamed protein product [Lactuca virosa]
MADERAGAEIVCGDEDCGRYSFDLLEELGFPKGILPLKDLVECGRVRQTGYVWLKQKAPCEHFFKEANATVSYATEITAYIEKCKMTKVTGIKSKKMMMWVPVVELSMENEKSSKIYFKTSIGVGKSYPVTAFVTDEEKKKYLEPSK